MSQVTLQTSMGTILLELYVDEAPKTCHNFHELSQRGYYNGTKFHRIIKVGFRDNSRDLLFKVVTQRELEEVVPAYTMVLRLKMK